MYSKLCDGIIETNNRGDRNANICKATIHHMFAKWSGKRCAEEFATTSRQASANYCIGVNGDLYCSVPEEYRAWTSSNKTNDSQAITIEVANSSLNYPYPISEKSWNKLVELCVDICERYNFRLNFDGTPNGSLTAHRMFASTDCPGDYLYSRFNELEYVVNKKLDERKMLKLEEIVDLDLYNDLYVDLQQAFKGNKAKLLEHLKNFGIKEGRVFSLVYNPQHYKEKYEDLRKAYGNDWYKYYEHYITYGHKEGREASCLFDINYYKANNSDLKDMSNKELVQHFCLYGCKEFRKTSKDFDVLKYRDYYSDLRKEFKNDCKRYYEHYVIYGGKEKRKCI